MYPIKNGRKKKLILKHAAYRVLFLMVILSLTVGDDIVASIVVFFLIYALVHMKVNIVVVCGAKVY